MRTLVAWTGGVSICCTTDVVSELPVNTCEYVQFVILDIMCVQEFEWSQGEADLMF